MDPLLLITNSGAGGLAGAGGTGLEQALAVLRARCDVEVAATSNPGELDGVLHRRGSRRVVVAGGDGSMHAVVAALHKRGELSEAVLALVPLGTGNDFARSVGIPLDPEEAATVVLDGTPSPVDLIVDEVGGIVVNNVHAGAGAQASRRAHRWKERLGHVGLGRLGYPIGALLAAFQPPYVRLHVEIDGQVVVDVDRPVLMVAVGNGAHVGGGTELNPEAEADSGRLDVVVSLSTGLPAQLGYMLRLRRGEHHERSDVLNVSARTVSISGGPFFCSADGEVYGPEDSRSWRIEPAAYRLIT